jgi:hypothetical protein
MHGIRELHQWLLVRLGFSGHSRGVTMCVGERENSASRLDDEPEEFVAAGKARGGSNRRRT